MSYRSHDKVLSEITMMKQKVIGIVNILIGAFYIIFALSFDIFIRRQMQFAYTHFDDQVSMELSIPMILLIGLGIVNIVCGSVFFTKSKKRDSFYIYGILLAVSTFLIGGVLTALMTLSSVLPLYSVTQGF